MVPRLSRPLEERDMSDIQPELSARLQNELRRFRSNLSVIQSDCRAALGQTVSEGWWCRSSVGVRRKKVDALRPHRTIVGPQTYVGYRESVSQPKANAFRSPTRIADSQPGAHKTVCVRSARDGALLYRSLIAPHRRHALKTNAVVHWMGSVWQRVR